MWVEPNRHSQERWRWLLAENPQSFFLRAACRLRAFLLPVVGRRPRPLFCAWRCRCEHDFHQLGCEVGGIAGVEVDQNYDSCATLGDDLEGSAGSLLAAIVAN